MYRKSYCIIPAGDVAGIIGVSEMFKCFFMCDGQDADRQAILYVDRSC